MIDDVLLHELQDHPEVESLFIEELNDHPGMLSAKLIIALFDLQNWRRTLREMSNEELLIMLKRISQRYLRGQN